MGIDIRNIHKSFGQFQALHDVSLQIAAGELIALLGPSGCGKTTLLRIIAGLETPDAGSIHFNGQDTTAVHVRERNVGFVFQHYALFRHMTVFDNVAFGLRVKPRRQRPSAAQIRARVTRLLELVQLDWLANRFPAQLSGGQRQRIALARALAVEPKVLLLDEPFGALDAKVRKELRRWLRRLHDELHVTSIFVTHDQEEALEVADRVIVIRQGRIEQQGTPQDVWEHPATPFVYDFLGDVNRFAARTSDGNIHLLHADGAVSGTAHPPMVAYVRPHDLEVERYVPGSVTQGIVVQLERAIVVGALARLELVTAPGTTGARHALGLANDHPQTIEAQIPAQQFQGMGLRTGETLVVTPRRAKVFQVPDARVLFASHDPQQG